MIGASCIPGSMARKGHIEAVFPPTDVTTQPRPLGSGVEEPVSLFSFIDCTRFRTFSIKQELKSHPKRGYKMSECKVPEPLWTKSRLANVSLEKKFEFQLNLHYASKSLNGPVLLWIDSVALEILTPSKSHCVFVKALLMDFVLCHITLPTW